MFFFRNKHIMIDLGTGNNNKINWPMEDEQELIDIIETVYRGARKGRGLVISPKVLSSSIPYFFFSLSRSFIKTSINIFITRTCLSFIFTYLFARY
jgi:Mitosis protein DIM1